MPNATWNPIRTPLEGGLIILHNGGINTERLELVSVLMKTAGTANRAASSTRMRFSIPPVVPHRQSELDVTVSGSPDAAAQMLNNPDMDDFHDQAAIHRLHEEKKAASPTSLSYGQY